MKKFINKVLVLLLVLFVGISLTACEEETTTTYNTNTPYGALSNDTIYASIGNIKLSEKQLYDELRGVAYDYLFEEIINTIVKPEDYNLTVANNSEELVELVNEACFGTSDEEDLKAMNASTKSTYVKKYVDTMYLQNVVITEESILSGEYTEECLAYYLKDLARKYFAKELLTNEDSEYYWEKEFVTVDGEETKNIYYIDEETIESAYNSNQTAEAKYTVVIVGFNTLAEAQKALEGYNETSLTYEDFKEIYYNTYSYKNETNDNFELTSEKLGVQNTSLISMVKNMEKGDFKLYQQFGNSVYHVYLEEEQPENEWEDLTDDEKAAVKGETVDQIIEDKLTSSIISSLIIDKV